MWEEYAKRQSQGYVQVGRGVVDQDWEGARNMAETATGSYPLSQVQSINMGQYIPTQGFC